MKLKFEISNINWKSQFEKHNIMGISFQIFDDKGLPSSYTLEVDRPKLKLSNFPKEEYKPGKFSWMSNKSINFCRRELKNVFHDTPTALFIESIEEVK